MCTTTEAQSYTHVLCKNRILAYSVMEFFFVFVYLQDFFWCRVLRWLSEIYLRIMLNVQTNEMKKKTIRIDIIFHCMYFCCVDGTVC